jgi:hypothetical protein
MQPGKRSTASTLFSKRFARFLHESLVYAAAGIYEMASKLTL